MNVNWVRIGVAYTIDGRPGIQSPDGWQMESFHVFKDGICPLFHYYFSPLQSFQEAEQRRLQFTELIIDSTFTRNCCANCWEEHCRLWHLLQVMRQRLQSY